VHNSLQQVHCMMHRGRRPLGEWGNYNAFNPCFYLELYPCILKFNTAVCCIMHARGKQVDLAFFFVRLSRFVTLKLLLYFETIAKFRMLSFNLWNLYYQLSLFHGIHKFNVISRNRSIFFPSYPFAVSGS